MKHANNLSGFKPINLFFKKSLHTFHLIWPACSELEILIPLLFALYFLFIHSAHTLLLINFVHDEFICCFSLLNFFFLEQFLLRGQVWGLQLFVE